MSEATRTQRPPTPNRQETGRLGERLAERFAVHRGWRVIGRNVRLGRRGEVDLVLERTGPLGPEHCLCEVRTRRAPCQTRPEETVRGRKRARMLRLALLWAARTAPDVAVSVALVAIVLTERHAFATWLEVPG